MTEKQVTVAQKTTAALMNWNDPAMQVQIRKAYGGSLNDQEWGLFLGLGIATGLNPFLREIWALKYGNNPATVFIGRDGYRRSAQNHPDYEYHYAAALYSKDLFKIVNGEVQHEFNMADRGALTASYCVVKRKSAARPAITTIKTSEYMQPHGVWKTKPETMSNKVAEAQGLRGSFQELFAGTYEESENWEKPAVPATPSPKPADMYGGNIVEAQVVDTPPPESAINKAARETMEEYGDIPSAPPAPPVKAHPMPQPAPRAPEAQRQPPEAAIPAGKIRTDQTRKLFAVWGEYTKITRVSPKDSQPARKKMMQELFGVDSSVKLNEEQADTLIAHIEKLTKATPEGEYQTAEDLGMQQM